MTPHSDSPPEMNRARLIGHGWTDLGLSQAGTWGFASPHGFLAAGEYDSRLAWPWLYTWGDPDGQSCVVACPDFDTFCRLLGFIARAGA